MGWDIPMSMLDIVNGIYKRAGKEFVHDENASIEKHMQQVVDWYNQSKGNLNEIDGYNCEVCKNKGFIALLDGNGYEVRRACKCQKIRATLNRARKSGLGDIITEYTFDRYKDVEDWQKYIKNTAIAFCSDDAAHWFYIGGQVGAGKSHICTAIAAYYIKQARNVCYMLWGEESKLLKALANTAQYYTEIEKWKSADVLYIDDFLKVKNGETPTTADMNLAFEIINHRIIDREKVTIISSEKTLDQLMEYDEATMSRIYQKAGRYKISIAKDKAKNYRLRGCDNELQLYATYEETKIGC